MNMNKALFCFLEQIHNGRTTFIPQHIRNLLQGLSLVSERLFTLRLTLLHTNCLVRGEYNQIVLLCRVLTNLMALSSA